MAAKFHAAEKLQQQKGADYSIWKFNDLKYAGGFPLVLSVTSYVILESQTRRTRPRYIIGHIYLEIQYENMSGEEFAVETRKDTFELTVQC